MRSRSPYPNAIWPLSAAQLVQVGRAVPRTRPNDLEIKVLGTAGERTRVLVTDSDRGSAPHFPLAYCQPRLAPAAFRWRCPPISRGFLSSGRRDLNSGPLVPQTSALTRLRHAPWRGSYRLRAVTPVELVDQVRHALEPVGDHAQAIFAEVLWFDAECAGERLDHVV